MSQKATAFGSKRKADPMRMKGIRPCFAQAEIVFGDSSSNAPSWTAVNRCLVRAIVSATEMPSVEAPAWTEGRVPSAGLVDGGLAMLETGFLGTCCFLYTLYLTSHISTERRLTRKGLGRSFWECCKVCNGVHRSN